MLTNISEGYGLRADMMRDRFVDLPRDLQEKIFALVTRSQAARRIQAAWRGLTQGMRKYIFEQYEYILYRASVLTGRPVMNARAARALLLQDVGLGGLSGMDLRSRLSQIWLRARLSPLDRITISRLPTRSAIQAAQDDIIRSTFNYVLTTF